nr:MAG TPA: hypothetical protein [Caudoviricetes sp.]
MAPRQRGSRRRKNSGHILNEVSYKWTKIN